MSHVVAVLLVEGVVRDEAEPFAPEGEAFVEREADALKEEGVLQPAVVLQVRGAAQRAVQVRHAEGEVAGRDEGVDRRVAEGRVGAEEGGVRGGGGGVGRGEVLGQVGEDRGQAVVFVEAREGPGGLLVWRIPVSEGFAGEWRERGRERENLLMLQRRSCS